MNNEQLDGIKNAIQAIGCIVIANVWFAASIASGNKACFAIGICWTAFAIVVKLSSQLKKEETK